MDSRPVTISRDDQGRVISVRRGNDVTSTSSADASVEKTDEQTLKRKGVRNASKLVTTPVEYVQGEYERKLAEQESKATESTASSIQPIASGVDGGVIIRSNITGDNIRLKTLAQDGIDRQYTPISSEGYVPATFIDQIKINKKIQVASRNTGDVEYADALNNRYRKGQFSDEYVAITPENALSPSITSVASTTKERGGLILQDITGQQRDNKPIGKQYNYKIQNFDGASDSFARDVDDFQTKDQQLMGIRTKVNNLFKNVPFLDGDNYVQQGTREILTLPYDFTVGFGVQSASAIQKTYLAGRGLVVERESTLKELARAKNQVPAIIQDTFNPKNPAFAANLLGSVVGARGIAKSARPVPAGDFTGTGRNVPFLRQTNTFGDPSNVPSMRPQALTILEGTESSTGWGKVFNAKFKVRYDIFEDGGYLKQSKFGDKTIIEFGQVSKKSGKLDVAFGEFSGTKQVSYGFTQTNRNNLFNEFDVEVKSTADNTVIQSSPYVLTQIGRQQGTGYSKIGKNKILTVEFESLISVEQTPSKARAQVKTSAFKQEFIEPVDVFSGESFQGKFTANRFTSLGSELSPAQRRSVQIALGDERTVYPARQVLSKNVLEPTVAREGKINYFTKTDVYYNYKSGFLEQYGVLSKIKDVEQFSFQIKNMKNRPSRNFTFSFKRNKAQKSMEDFSQTKTKMFDTFRKDKNVKVLDYDKGAVKIGLKTEQLQVQRLKLVNEKVARVRVPQELRAKTQLISRSRSISLLTSPQKTDTVQRLSEITKVKEVIQQRVKPLAIQKVNAVQVQKVRSFQINDLNVPKTPIPNTKFDFNSPKVPLPPRIDEIVKPANRNLPLGYGNSGSSVRKGKRAKFGYSRSFFSAFIKKPRNYNNKLAGATGIGVRF